MYEFYEGPVYKTFSRLPLYKTQLNSEKIMRYKMIMECITDNELDGPKPEHSVARKTEIARGSRQDVEQVSKMLREYKKLERGWRSLDRYMSYTNQMEMAALFWHEITTPFYIEMVPKANKTPLSLPPRKLFSRKKRSQKLPPRKSELMNWLKWVLIFGFLFFGFW